MTEIFALRARLAGGWAHNVAVVVEAGRIARVSTDATPGANAARVDTLLPAVANVHSHSFQRAMAGMTERRAAERDSFWTWRDLMYRFANALSPDEIEVIAALAFMEMLEAGFASVGEFHYLHHQLGGKPYAALAETSARIATAAAETGIGLTLLPVFYRYSGVGAKPLAPEQLRFGNDVERFNRIVAEARERIEGAGADARVGIAPHSLRAIVPDDLRQLVRAHNTDGSIHMHVAEQPKEVADVQAAFGATPVRWLLDNIGLDGRWCCVHATHMTGEEALALAASGAVAGLCPITEANLGDGAFNGAVYFAANGAYGIGTDSNIRISAAEELRALEYSQRLRDLSRNVLATMEGDVGENLYLGGAEGGAKALGREAGAIDVGRLADLVAIDSAHPSLCALRDDQLLSGFCFAAGSEVVTDVWSAGRHCVKAGRHPRRDEIIARYRKAVSALLAKI